MGVESLLLFHRGRPVPTAGTLAAVVIVAVLLMSVAALAAIVGHPAGSHLMAPMRWWPVEGSIG